MKDNNTDNDYVVYFKPWEFHYLWEDIELALHSAQKECFMQDEFGEFHDLTDYGAIKLLKGLREAFKKADKEHICVDDRFV